MVTEHRYTAAGELEVTIEYPENALGVSPSGAVIASASYETPEMGNGYLFNPTIAGMTFAGYSGITGNNSIAAFAAAPDGDQVAFLQSYAGVNGSISQSLSGLVAGHHYDVRFMLAARPIEGGGTPITVSFNGVVLGTFNPASTAFQEFTVVFTATGSTGTLTFSNMGCVINGATALDNVRLAALPELGDHRSPAKRLARRASRPKLDQDHHQPI